MIECVDCLREGVTTSRPAPHGGPRSRRCVTHHRVERKRVRLAAAQRRVEKTYEMPPEVYDAMLAAQDGRCAICRKARGVKKRLCVDHNHKAGCDHPADRGCPDCWNGLLCNRCNELVGWYSVEELLRAIHYKTHPPARRQL
jgi:hypothetical protein